ncbi:MAG: AAA family ATPase [Candidatus Marinimicrobia bacterium]|nr:AAA family ATPase [Candidatus Neomarinimicrobiota bacterium]
MVTDKTSLLNFNSNDTESRPKILAVTSGKGGVGKTNMSVNLAILLSKLKKKVLLFDADIHLGNVDLFLGLRTQNTIADVITGKKTLKEVIVQGPEEIDVLPASSAVIDMIEMGDEIIRKLGFVFSRYENNYDYIVVDTGAGLNNQVLPFVLASDKAVVLVTKDPASIADAYGMIKIIKKYHKTLPIALVVNMVQDITEGKSLYKKMDLMVNRFLGGNIFYAGSLLEDAKIKDSIRTQVPLAIKYPNSDATQIMKNITRNILNIPVEEKRKKIKFFDRINSNKNIPLGD